MKIIKRTLLIVLLLGWGFFLCSCNTSKKIINLNIVSKPQKIDYYLGENLELDGLVVQIVYNDGSYKIIDDYEIVYSDLILGKNTIMIKYQDFVDYFDVMISKREKTKLLEYPDFSNIKNSPFDISQVNQFFNNVEFATTRGTDMVIVYDENNFVNTNIYGYEIAVDKLGRVVQKDIKVDVPENGYVVSAHGTSSHKLKQVEIGNYVLYVGNSIFISNDDQLSKNEVFFKFISLVNLLETVTDLRTYNAFVLELNETIPTINNLFIDYKDEIAFEVYSQLQEIEQKYDFTPYEHLHQYSYLDVKYETFEVMENDDKNYVLTSIYTDKLYYGGFRNTDTLVHYDQSTYRTRNEYGYEVGVDENGYVVEIGTLVELPLNGYILSGHGKGGDFLRENIALKDKINIDEDGVNVYKDLYATFYNAQIIPYNEIINLVNEEMEQAIPHDYQYIDKVIKSIYSKLKTIGKELTFYNLHQLSTINKISEEYISILYGQITDYKINKTCAMWYYPFKGGSAYDDTSIEGVCNTLDKLKKMGFNEIIILPFVGNYILYDSKYFYKTDVLKDCNYGIYGNDYLKCFISEAHKRNISVNAFTQTFRCYLEGSKVLTEKHYQVEYNGELSKGNIYYYDICNDEVQNTLYNWYLELVSLYDFDKIEYDIIRYSQSNLYNYLEDDVISSTTKIIDPGYSEYSMNKFLTKNNLEGDLRTLILNNKDVRKKWLEFKENELVNFIIRTTSGIKKIKPDILVTAAVFNDFDSASKGFLQDAKKWLDLGIVDQIEPMVYSSDPLFVQNKIEYYQENLNEDDFRIGIGNNISLLDLCKQIYYTDDNGVVIFSSSEYLKNRYVDILTMNHHLDVVSCINSSQEITQAIINDLIDKIEYYFEIKNNENYDYLIDLIKVKNFDKLYLELSSCNDQLMANYILDIINSIDKE